MNTETTFKKTLINELRKIVESQDQGEDFVQTQYVETKAEVIRELLDYYTERLLMYPPFAAEFKSDEISSLSDFLQFLRNDVTKGRTTWPEIQKRALILSNKIS